MIYVFKTSVHTTTDLQTLRPHLDELLRQGRWNFDLQDCDRILRVDSPNEITQGILHLLHQTGFECEELV